MFVCCVFCPVYPSAGGPWRDLGGKIKNRPPAGDFVGGTFKCPEGNDQHYIFHNFSSNTSELMDPSIASDVSRFVLLCIAFDLMLR